MAARFHIEELISQDQSGVIFRASDQETGKDVTVRRFFPHGMDEGGLKEHERKAFEIAIQRFACATHPALRQVIAGGCDTVDGVPFIVTEWVEGAPVSDLLIAGPLNPRRAIDILMGALEVSEVISELVSEQAVWVETNPTLIIEGAESSGRGTTFGISPFKWHGSDDERRSLKPIVLLTEDLMGWRNKLVNDQAGNGLAVWLKWLKQNMAQATLAETRKALADATGAPPPPPTSRLVRQSTKPMVPRAATVQVATPVRKPKKPSKLPLVLSLVVLLSALGAGGWAVKAGKISFKGRFSTGEAETASAPKKSALDYAPPIVPRDQEPEETPPPASAPAPSATTSGSEKIYKMQDTSALVKMENKTAILEGKVDGVYLNQDKTQIFIQMEKTAGNDACGFVISKDATGSLSLDELKKLEGKTIRIRGKVGVGSGAFGKRPKIQIKDRESITLP